MFIPSDIFTKHFRTLYLKRDHYALRYTIEHTLYYLRKHGPYGDLIDTDKLQLDSHVLNLILSFLSDEEKLEVSLVN